MYSHQTAVVTQRGPFILTSVPVWMMKHLVILIIKFFPSLPSSVGLTSFDVRGFSEMGS